MKPGDLVWVVGAKGVQKGSLDALSNLAAVWVQIEDFSYCWRREDVFTTEKAAIEALLERQTKAYAQLTDQHKDLLAKLTKRLEDL